MGLESTQLVEFVRSELWRRACAAASEVNSWTAGSGRSGEKRRQSVRPVQRIVDRPRGKRSTILPHPGLSICDPDRRFQESPRGQVTTKSWITLSLRFSLGTAKSEDLRFSDFVSRSYVNQKRPGFDRGEWEDCSNVEQVSLRGPDH